MKKIRKFTPSVRNFKTQELTLDLEGSPNFELLFSSDYYEEDVFSGYENEFDYAIMQYLLIETDLEYIIANCVTCHLEYVRDAIISHCIDSYDKESSFYSYVIKNDDFYDEVRFNTKEEVLEKILNHKDKVRLY